MSSTSTPPESRKKKKRRHLATSISVIPESKTRASPIIGYFPSGYNPTSSTSPDPAVALFRDALHPSRFDLLVTPPPPANVRFLASNYKGEPAAPQICSYALGVLDKDSGSLRIIPIASNKILRLEPRVIEGVVREEAAAEEDGASGMKDLTQMFGTKTNKRKDRVWSSLNQQQNDPSTRENLDVRVSDPEIKDDSVQDASGTIIRNIPPYDSSAVVPEKAYLLDEIILSSEWGSLKDILEFTQSGAGAKATFWQENEYPSFVINRIHKLREIQDEVTKEKHAVILSFITHLVKFWNLRKSSRHSNSRSSNTHSHKIPRTIQSRFARMFIDPVSDKMSTETKELLIGYILVLTLFIDNFVTDPVDIAKDMEMTTESLQPYYYQLGCKNVAPEGRAMKTHIKLQAPLEFRDLKKRRNRKQRG